MWVVVVVVYSWASSNVVVVVVHSSIHGTFHHLDWIDGVTLGACEWKLAIVRSGAHTRCERILGRPANVVVVVEVEEDGKRKWWWWHEDPREGHTTGNTR